MREDKKTNVLDKANKTERSIEERIKWCRCKRKDLKANRKKKEKFINIYKYIDM